MDKSFYALEIFVQPGGARESLVFVFDNLEDIQRALAKCLSHHLDIYLMTWYGRDVNLLVYQEGKEVQKLNLLPYIHITIEGYPEIGYDENGNLQGLKFSNQSYRKGYDDSESFEVDGKKFIDNLDALSFTSTINWNAIPVQALQGDLVKKGDKVTIFSNYMEAEELVGYGLNETEYGLHKENIDWDDDEFGLGEEDEIDWADEDWEVCEGEDWQPIP
jgi:hypothetical protein